MKQIPEPPQAVDKRTLVRDVAVFQVKLIVDGLRDLVLVPMALVAGLLSLFSGEGGQPGPQFYRLLELGKQSERWINLFGATRHAPADMVNTFNFPDADMDKIVDTIETFVVDEEKRGGMTAQARARMEKTLRGLKNR